MRPRRRLLGLIMGGLTLSIPCAHASASGAPETFAVFKDKAFAGADFELDLAAADAASCRNACALSEICCAYTFASACRLKAFAAAPASSAGAVSGVKSECEGKAAPAAMAERLKGKERDLLTRRPRQDSYWRTLRMPPGAESASLVSALPFEAKVLPIPMEVLDFMRAMNALEGYSEVPLRAELPDDYAADFRAALAGLPEIVKAKVSRKLKAVLWAADVVST
jgi:hypothetical protein